MYLHQMPATGNVATLLEIGKCYACGCMEQILRGLQHGIGLRLNFFFFFLLSPHAGMKQAHWTRCSEKASVHNNTAEHPSHQRKRRHYHPFIFTQCVFQRKKKKERIYIESSGKWAMGLPIKETIYTWRHSKHKLPLSSENWISFNLPRVPSQRKTPFSI